MPFQSPPEIVTTLCRAGRAKAQIDPWRQLLLGFLAGAYVGFGGLLAVTVGLGSPGLKETMPGLQKLLFAAVFPVGISMLVINGSELFTGNCGIITLACVSGKARWRDLLRNWGIVYVGNALGAVFVAAVLSYATQLVDVRASGFAGILGTAVAGVAEAKANLSWGVAFLRAIGCNWMVCLAIWMATASEDVISKIISLWFPVMAFAAIGFEHSIANLYFVPLGMLNGAAVTVGQFLWANLLPVTLGNLIGGALFVGCVYGWIYRKAALEA